ncbi:MAG TPA: helix-turn-helix transcriptional regulator [Nevskiales bacterium]|nr:helix-turn-helix transcriptional regulator [Nevskiales bacterium]
MPKVAEKVSAFGARLASLRKAAGYTQTELAEALGTTQRMITYYETRAEKAPAALLPKMAGVFGVSTDELLGLKQPKKSKAPDTRLTRRLQQIEKLDPQEKRQVITLLDAFIERAQLKQASR